MTSANIRLDGEEEDDMDDRLPLHSKKAFGAGLYRKPVVFLPAKTGDLTTTTTITTTEPPARSKSAAELYLDLVLPKDGESDNATSEIAATQMCEVCELPLSGDRTGASSKPQVRRHEASLVHQVCLTHSHPPSALDRSRMGLSVLQSQGWDPDSRRGLGSALQGVQYPIKTQEKHDNLGIGVKVPKKLEVYRKEKPRKLDAGKVRKMAAEDKKRREKLQQQFYGSGDLEKYLGSN